MVILASPNTLGHSPKAKFGGDDDRGPLVEPADEVEQELAAGLGEGQIAEFIEDDEVHTGQMIGKTALASIADLGLEPVDEIHHIVEPAAGAAADAASNNGDGKMGLAGAGRASVMMPGVWVLRCRSSTRFILDTVTLWVFSAASNTVAKSISSSGNRMAH